MTADTQSLDFHRCDPACNMARFYRLGVTRDLFGQIVIVRQWGRIGTSGRQMTEAMPNYEAAALRVRLLAEGKQRRGYRPAVG